MILLLPSLSLHLLHFNGVGFSAAHIQLVVSHAQSQDALVYAQSRRIEYKVLQKEQIRLDIYRQIINTMNK